MQTANMPAPTKHFEIGRTRHSGFAYALVLMELNGEAVVVRVKRIERGPGRKPRTLTTGPLPWDLLTQYSGDDRKPCAAYLVFRLRTWLRDPARTPEELQFGQPLFERWERLREEAEAKQARGCVTQRWSRV